MLKFADLAMKATTLSLVGLTAYYTLFIMDRGMAIMQGRTERQQIRILADPGGDGSDAPPGSSATRPE